MSERTMTEPPLILTLALEPKDFEYFEALRQQHFPPGRNFIAAHLTLFHALPNNESTINTVKGTADAYTPFLLNVTKPASIGNGVVFRMESQALTELHKSLQHTWMDLLSRQDRQTLWPHITVQNKVNADEAKNLLIQLTESFVPFTVQATGLQLWEYLNGPWRLVDTFYFR
jgi:2'-5' RNA ligase